MERCRVNINACLENLLRRNYELNSLESALAAVVDEGLSFSQAAERHGVPKTTVYRRYRGMNPDKLGKPTVLSAAEEKTIVEAPLIAANYGYPFIEKDLREFVQ